MRTIYHRSLVVALLLASTASMCRAGDGWKSLFNGKDLAGWTPRNPAAKRSGSPAET